MADRDRLRILGISGGLRAGSYNKRLLQIAGALMAEHVELVIFDGLKAIPPFDEDDEHRPPAAVDELRERIAWADGLLIATPEYNASVPGQLKNALDWASRPVARAALRNKHAAAVGSSTGLFGAAWAQAELRKVLATAGARVLDRDLAIPLIDEQLADYGGELAPETLAELEDLVAAFVTEIRATCSRRDQTSTVS